MDTVHATLMLKTGHGNSKTDEVLRSWFGRAGLRAAQIRGQVSEQQVALIGEAPQPLETSDNSSPVGALDPTPSPTTLLPDNEVHEACHRRASLNELELDTDLTSDGATYLLEADDESHHLPICPIPLD